VVTQMLQPRRPQLGQLHQVAVRIADGGNPRLRAEAAGRVAELDLVFGQPGDERVQLEHQESNLYRAGGGRLAGVVGRRVDREMHITQLASPVRLGVTVALLRQG